MNSISTRAIRPSYLLNCFRRTSARLFLRRQSTAAANRTQYKNRIHNNYHKNRPRFLAPSNQIRNMSGKNEPCEACKTQPPVIGSGYKEKGNYETIADHKAYVVQTTPTPKSGILICYDIFGFFPQTLQGADQIALTVPAVVVMPDFFHGEPMDIKNFPPDTDEKKQKLGAFFAGPAQPPKTIEATKKVMAELKQKYPSVEKWGVIGLCWGGKVATLLSQSGDFAASAQLHPAMLDAEDVKKVDIPHLMLASKDEDKSTVEECSEILEGKNNKSQVKTYPNDIHGWMGARGNLENTEEAKSFQNGYNDVIQFFKSVLTEKSLGEVSAKI